MHPFQLRGGLIAIIPLFLHKNRTPLAGLSTKNIIFCKKLVIFAGVNAPEAGSIIPIRIWAEIKSIKKKLITELKER
jgi:hypothetical protein